MQRRLEESRRNELDLQARVEALEFDLEMARRNANSSSQAKDVMNKKEEELLRELTQSRELCRDKDFELEKQANDLLRLRTQLERSAQDSERLKQNLDFSEQTLAEKDREKHALMT